MGRPTEEKRDRWLKIRMTEREREQIERLSRESGKSMTDIVVKAIERYRNDGR